MADRAVELSVAGTTCRVVTTASAEELAELAAMVEERLPRAAKVGKRLTPQAILLAAIALAHEVREGRARSTAIAEHARGSLEQLLRRVDEVLERHAELASETEGARPAAAATAAASPPEPLAAARHDEAGAVVGPAAAGPGRAAARRDRDDVAPAAIVPAVSRRRRDERERTRG